MAQIKNKIQNKNILWSSRKRFRIGDACSYNDVNYVNVTGRNTEPGTGSDWVKTSTLIEVIDNLVSIEIGKALSANQGRVLKDLIDGNTSKFGDYILLTEKGAANGVAILDSNGKIVSSQYGDLAVTDTIQATENALSAFTTNNANYTFQQGDIIVLAADADGNIAHYLFKGGDKSLEASYSKLNATKIPISSVIGLQAALDARYRKEGEVELLVKDFGNAANTHMQLVYRSDLASFRLVPTVSGITGNQNFDFSLFRDGVYKKVLLEGDVSGEKPPKVITNTTQYTAIAEDKDKFLVFNNAINFLIPANLFAADDVIDAKSKADFVTVVGDTGMTVNVVSSQTKQIPQHGFFGMRFESPTVAGLYGQTKPI
ncbi:hypothetical protein [Christiangramia sp.]|uniref:hypothetical protein n=1 Tax=Christiangramia sp. TaxID=1931228 RepID=UPI0026163FBF|nr:hypothetical protein [Christiangramia sp.]